MFRSNVLLPPVKERWATQTRKERLSLLRAGDFTTQQWKSSSGGVTRTCGLHVSLVQQNSVSAYKCSTLGIRVKQNLETTILVDEILARNVK